MIAETTLLLILIALFSSLKIGVKADKIFSFITFTSVFLLFLHFFEQSSNLTKEVFSVLWNSSASGDITIEIISDSYNCQLILPFFLITLGAIGSNLIFRYEERRNTYNAVLLFNLVALIMMITSNNFVQLLSGVFIIDILSLLLIKDIDKSCRYIFLNVFADMLLFTVFAVINAQIDSLDINKTHNYRQIGMHLDFISLCSLTALFLKIGFIPFQTGLTALKDIRFHRLQNILFLTSGITALMLLLKFNPIWSVSPYFILYLNIICITSLLFGFIGLIITEDIRLKLIYLLMITNAVIVKILQLNGFVWNTQLSFILISAYISSCLLYLLYYTADRKTSITQISQQTNVSIALKSSVFLLMLLNVTTLNHTLTQLNPPFLFGLILIFMTSYASIMKKTIFHRTGDLTPYDAKPVILLFLFITFLLSNELKNINILDYSIGLYALVFLIFSLLYPTITNKKINFPENLQKFDSYDVIYRKIIINPLYISGKILWLLIDWLLMEKLIIGTLTLALQTLLRLFRRLHNHKEIGTTAIVVVIFAGLFLSYWIGGK